MVTAAHIGKEQQRVAVESPVTAQLVVQGAGQRNDAVLVAPAADAGRWVKALKNGVRELFFRHGNIHYRLPS